ncbi:pyruvate dehydrogenase E1 component subunit alpha [Monoraphidium neglectum]|uniref:Pyruvate dehydrogenase E1 component subunit alpha n=1 Tax=Monoraphidium neglectum TaxID=145388 RepID=A0A0D2KV51_9CHLO|nr:pyruvate dehydrogenase E1 component subunit alpha [Monoraphidium neglectum]KIY99248.1 pyruvate dehydrogenase E1 component subunit alpha [Monoraphidium neglectum]|eukprot:XP_013898268.1 pyruvate dehydrogenase E1 component subunit alpha [Monoraphidium neglectum]
MLSSMTNRAPAQRAAVRTRGPQRAALRVCAVATTAKKDAAAAPAKGLITPEAAKEVYYDMVLGREFEEMCAQMYYRGKMFGFVHLYSGQEAVSSGVIKLLRPDDHVCSTYRDHVHALSKGVPAREIMAELFGKSTGCCRGQGGSMHIFSAKHGVLGGYAFIGEGIPIGVGAAFKSAYRRNVLGDESSDSVTVSFFGDGTCNVGQFYESLNMAALYKLPHIFVVENNKWAIGMSHGRATNPTLGDEDPYIYKKGPAFGMPGVHVDGMDVLKVREVAQEAIARARRGDGPTLIEAETYRFRGHSLADPDELRSKEEKAKYAARDPIPQLKDYMLANGLATEADIKEIHDKVMAEVEDSVKFADESPKPDKGQLLENVFADPRGFGIAPDGRYRYELPGFTTGTAQVS